MCATRTTVLVETLNPAQSNPATPVRLTRTIAFHLQQHRLLNNNAVVHSITEVKICRPNKWYAYKVSCKESVQE